MILGQALSQRMVKLFATSVMKVSRMNSGADRERRCHESTLLLEGSHPGQIQSLGRGVLAALKPRHPIMRDWRPSGECLRRAARQPGSRPRARSRSGRRSAKPHGESFPNGSVLGHHQRALGKFEFARAIHDGAPVRRLCWAVLDPRSPWPATSRRICGRCAAGEDLGRAKSRAPRDKKKERFAGYRATPSNHIQP